MSDAQFYSTHALMYGGKKEAEMVEPELAAAIDHYHTVVQEAARDSFVTECVSSWCCPRRGRGIAPMSGLVFRESPFMGAETRPLGHGRGPSSAVLTHRMSTPDSDSRAGRQPGRAV